MKTQRINITQAKEISILQLLLQLGYNPSKVKGNHEAWFCSPLRKENTASFKVNTQINKWYDFAEGIGGNTLDLIIKLNNTDVKGALNFLSQYSDHFSFDKQNTIEDAFKSLGIKNTKVFEYYRNQSYNHNQRNYIIKKVQPLQNAALIQYLEKRKINIKIASKYVNEIYYSLGDKNYFAICFENDLGGWEWRNKLYKGCLRKKAITLIKNDSKQLIVFEGFFDFLSWLSHLEIKKLNHDVLVLNSVALIDQNSELFKQYESIDCYLDNDTAGQNGFKKLS